MISQRLSGLLLLMLLGITAALYWPGLQGPLVLDDWENLVVLKQLDNPEAAWTDVIYNKPGPLGRPVAMISFVANYAASGMDTWTFKYTNLMLHLIAGCLVFWLAGRLLEGIVSPQQQWPVALWAAALWLLSPLLASTVLYTVQRMTQLSTLFVLAGCLSYVIGRRTLAENRWLGGLLTLSALCLWWPLAAYSKENGLLLPFLLLVIELFFFRFSGTTFTRRYLFAYFGLSVALPVIAGMAFFWKHPGWLLNAYASRDFTLVERLLTEPRVLFTYLGHLLLPTHSAAFGIFQDDFPVSTGWLNPVTTLAAIVGWLALLVAPLFIKAPRLRLLFFGILFFLAGHAMESSVFPLEIYFEHRNYLPAVGIFIALGIGLAFLAQRMEQPRLLLIPALALPLLTGFITYQRAATWSSQEIMLLTAAEYHPRSPRLNVALASLLANFGQPQQALELLDAAMQLNPRLRWGPALQRFDVYCTTRHPVPESAYTLPAWRSGESVLYSDQVFASSMLATLNRRLRNGECPTVDMKHFSAMIYDWAMGLPAEFHGTSHWQILFEAARTQELAHEPQMAMVLLDKAMTLYPHKIEAHLLAIMLQLAAGDNASARRILTEARFNDPKDQQYITAWLQRIDNSLDAPEPTKGGELSYK